MVFNEKGDKKNVDFEMILVNPKVIDQSVETDLEEEGCLSFPLIQGQVYRHKWISIDYQNIKGEKKSIKLEGWPARLFQHEFDHLDKVIIEILILIFFLFYFYFLLILFALNSSFIYI